MRIKRANLPPEYLIEHSKRGVRRGIELCYAGTDHGRGVVLFWSYTAASREKLYQWLRRRNGARW